jgi:predicted N-acyltransferase
MLIHTGSPALTVQVSRDVSAPWRELSAKWPLELGICWQQAEMGRITRRHLEVTVSDLRGSVFGARLLLLNGGEQRTGYHLYDLLAGADVRAAAARIRERGCADRLRREIEISSGMLSPWRHALMASAAAPSCYVPSVLYRLGLSSRELAAIIAGLRTVIPAQVTAVAIPSLPSSGYWRQLGTALEDNGFVRVSQPPAVTLHVPEKGWEGYLAGFRYKRRNTLQKERTRFQAQVTEVSLAPEIPQRFLDDAIALLGQRFTKFGHHEPPERLRDRLNRFRLVHPAGFIIAQRNEELVGFTAVAMDHANGRLIPRLGAVRTDIPYAYFNLTFYEPLLLAHRLGLHTIELGTQSYEAKLLRGAVLSSRHALIYPLDRTLRSALDHAAYVCDQIFSTEVDELTKTGARRQP